MATKKDAVKTPKTFIVQRTFEVIVQAIDLDDAIAQAAMFDPTLDREVRLEIAGENA